MLNLFTTVLVASVLLGQNETQPAEGDQATITERIRRNAEIAKQRLHALTEIEGMWDCEFSAKEDISWAGIKAGDKVRRRDKNEVLWGGTALSTEIGYVNEAGEFAVLLRELIGWDAKKKMIVSAGFMGHGAASYGTWTNTDRTWKAARNTVHPSGRESSGTHELTIVDENTYTVKQSEPAKTEVLTFKRVK